MVNIAPSQKKMFRLTITTRTRQMRRGRRNSPEPRQPKSWLQRFGIVTAGLIFLPVALFSFAVFVGLFLSMLAVVMVYVLCWRSKLRRMQSHQVINSEVVSDENGDEKLPEGKTNTWRQG